MIANFLEIRLSRFQIALLLSSLLLLGCGTSVQEPSAASSYPSPTTINNNASAKAEIAPSSTASQDVSSAPANSAGETTVAQESIGQWEMYEITLSSTVSYENPFTDVDVYADFASAEETIRVFGFYDGDGHGGQGNLWKIRFMVGQTGSWSWQTFSTDETNQGLHNQSGSVNVINSSEPGPLSPDPVYPAAWKHANGEYFFWNLGYSIHMLGSDRYHAGVGGWQDYLDWLQAHHFNGVMFTLQVPSFNACSTCSKGMAPWEALGGNPPPEYAFNNNGKVDYFVMPWAKKADPTDYGDSAATSDFSRFYLPFWLKVDEVVAEMQNKQMIAHIFQYDDQSFWPPASSQEEILYWNYMIRRLGAYWNVVFNDGIDLNEYRNLPAWVPEWQGYFQDHDPFGHARSSRHGDDDLGLATWRSMQAPDPTNINSWRELISRTPEKPVTEDDGIRARKGAGIQAERFMQLAWWSVLAGPGGFGATWAGGTDPGNWYSNLDADSEGMLFVEKRTRFILDFDNSEGEQIPFWKLEVRDDLVTGSRIYCSAVPGEHYLIYFDSGSEKSVSVDLKDVSSPLNATWFDPRTGQTISGDKASPGTTQVFSRPFEGPAVLYIGDATTPVGVVQNAYLPIIKQ